MHRAGRQIGATGAQRIGQRRRRQAELRHAAAVNGDAHFGRRNPPGARPAHAGHLIEFLAQRLGEFFEAPVRGGFADQRELHDTGFGGARFAELKPLQPRRQRAANGADVAHQLVIILFGIARPTELGGDDGGAIGRPRRGTDDIIEPLQHILDRLGDGLLHLGRIGAGLRRHDDDERRGEMRIDRARNGEQRRHADCGEQREQDQRDLPAPDRKIDEAHARTRTFWPSRSRSTPDRTTFSPAVSPDTISTPPSLILPSPTIVALTVPVRASKR